MRKFAIGFVSLAIIVGVFVLYSRLNKTPPLNTNAGGSFTGDSNLDNINDFRLEF